MKRLPTPFALSQGFGGDAAAAILVFSPSSYKNFPRPLLPSQLKGVNLQRREIDCLADRCRYDVAGKRCLRRVIRGEKPGHGAMSECNHGVRPSFHVTASKVMRV